MTRHREGGYPTLWTFGRTETGCLSLLAALICLLIIKETIMTMPNFLLQSLPGQIVGSQGESPTVTRIGVVAEIVEADNITVKISGSPVLVSASYLFPQYQPMVGDVVTVQKQDAAWFVLGTMSGALNTLLTNPSFELGGVSPTSWTVSTVDGGAGVGTFTKSVVSPLTGQFSGSVDLTPLGIGTSEMTLLSAPVPADPSSSWTGGIYLKILDLVGPNTALIFTGVRWFDGAGVSIGLASLSAVNNFSSTTPWTLLRPDSVTQSVVAPLNAAFAALEIQALMNVADPSTLYSLKFDYAILRQVA